MMHFFCEQFLGFSSLLETQFQSAWRLFDSSKICKDESKFLSFAFKIENVDERRLRQNKKKSVGFKGTERGFSSI